MAGKPELCVEIVALRGRIEPAHQLRQHVWMNGRVHFVDRDNAARIERAHDEGEHFDEGPRDVAFHQPRHLDRKRVVWGKCVSVRGDYGGGRMIKKKKKKK